MEKQKLSHSIQVKNVTVLQNPFSTETDILFSPSFPKERDFLFLTFTQWLAGNILEVEEKLFSVL